MSNLISIIVNCYNSEDFLDRCLESIKSQTYENFEVIFWDNCSTDKSQHIFNKYKSEKFKYFRSEKKLPLYEARNRAIEKAKGNIIAFLDCDDWWDKDLLKEREIFYINDKYTLCFSNCYHYFEKNKKRKIFINQPIQNGNLLPLLSSNYYVKISSLMLKRDLIINKINIFNKKYNIIGDYELVMELSKYENFFYFEKPQVYISFHKNNFSSKNRQMFYEEYLDWYKNVENDEQLKIFKKIFYRKLCHLRIIKNVINRQVTLKDFKDVLFIIPHLIDKIKLFILLLLPKKLIQYLFY